MQFNTIDLLKHHERETLHIYTISDMYRLVSTLENIDTKVSYPILDAFDNIAQYRLLYLTTNPCRPQHVHQEKHPILSDTTDSIL